MKHELIVSGYVSMDHVIKIASPAKVGCTSIVTNVDNTRIYYGGCSTNIAVALSHLGMPCMPILRVGMDYETNGFKQYLENHHVPTDAVTVLENEATSTCYLLQDENNDHITIFYPGSMHEKYARDIPDELLEDVKYGIITVAGHKDNSYYLNHLLEKDIPIIFGMKDDFNAFPKDFLEKILMNSRIIFLNEIEHEALKNLFGWDPLKYLFEKGKAETIVKTVGKDGSCCHYKENGQVRKLELGIYPLEKVVDATGAGDAYMSGFIYGLMKRESVERCCALGAGLSSFVLQAAGSTTNLPTVEELKNRAEVVYETLKK